MTKTGYERVIGIDVSSKKLDISDSKGKLPTVSIHDMVRNGQMWDPLSTQARDQAVASLATGTTCSLGH